MAEAAKGISEESWKRIRQMQQNERTEAEIYRRIAERMKDGQNKSTLLRLSAEEQRHCEIWKRYTGEEMQPERGKVWWYRMLAAVLGFTFAIKKMENGENAAQKSYDCIQEEVPEAREIRAQENEHEAALIEMLDEERLQYVGSMVLGLNDALVELTGTLAGLTFALQNTQIIALSGLITGISATLSMASSEFLSAKSEGRADALKSCIYTGITYLMTVALLILPYLLFPSQSYVAALGVMIGVVVLIILVFNYYIAVAKGLSFRRRFWEMAGISLGVAALSFLVGLVVKQVLGVDI